MNPDEVSIVAIEVIQDGLFQIDFRVNDNGYRCFVEPGKLFEMIGHSMQANHDEYNAKWLDEITEKE